MQMFVEFFNTDGPNLINASAIEHIGYPKDDDPNDVFTIKLFSGEIIHAKQDMQNNDAIDQLTSINSSVSEKQ